MQLFVVVVDWPTRKMFPQSSSSSSLIVYHYHHLILLFILSPVIVYANYMKQQHHGTVVHPFQHRNGDNVIRMDAGGSGQDIISSSLSSNPYLPMTKDLNFLLLRNGMPRMMAQQQPNNNHHHFNNGPSRPLRNDGPPPPPISFHNGPPGPPQHGPHAVFQPPPPNFKINSAPPMENNAIDFDLQTESTRENGEQWPVQPAPDQPKITFLDVKCDRNFMKVSIHFDKPFHGVIFSKGHYNYRNCIYLMPNSGVKKLFFDVSINSCGTTGNAQGTFFNEDVSADNGLFFENTIIIQYDPQVQEAWDQARKLRCTWHDQYEKAVSFRPFPVDMLDVVRADFAGDNVGCWMQIQVGKGPWASEVAGIVKIGQTMTMVLAIKDEENKFDMLVRNCIAHDGKRSPIELVDGNGCIVRPKLMTKFTKIKNFGSSASVLSYTHFQAFKFPDSMEVHFQCTIQICRFQCPDQCVKQAGDVINLYNDDGEQKRKRRDIQELQVSGTLIPPAKDDQKESEQKEIGLNKAIQVVSPRDLSFPMNSGNPEKMMLVDSEEIIESRENIICITPLSFMSALIAVALVCFACATIFLIFSKRTKKHYGTKFAGTVLAYVK